MKINKKIFWSVSVIVFLVVAVFVGKIIYDKIYEGQVKKALDEIGLDTGGIDIRGLTKEEIARKVTEKEIEKALNEMGVSMDEIDISEMDFSGLSKEEIYNLIYNEVLKQRAPGGKQEEGFAKEPLLLSPKTSNDTFVCENDNSVKAIGYVYLHGLGDHSSVAVDLLKSLTQNDSKTKGILDFDYNEQGTLDTISNDFALKFNTFKSQYDLEEVVIIGQSAGGVVAAYSAHKLNFDGDIELHTIASPLNGYGDFGATSKQAAENMAGFAKEIGLGFASFITPQGIKVYHHKTAEDEFLSSWCGDYASFCSSNVIQNNNIEGSKEFYYSGYSHTSIMPAVLEMIINCHQ